MSEDQMKGLFGGGDAGGDAGTARQMARQQRRAERRAARQRNPQEVERARDFINRYSTGNPSEGFSNEEAMHYLRELREEASPEDWQRAATATMNNLPADQRRAFNEMLERRRAGTGMVTIDRTGGAQATEGRAPGQPGGTGLDDMLGGLFGGLLGGGMAMPEPRGEPRGGGYASGGAPDMNPFDDFLGGLFGRDEPSPQARQQQPQQQRGAVEDVMSNPLGKAVLGGLAAFALKELIDKQNQR